MCYISIQLETPEILQKGQNHTVEKRNNLHQMVLTGLIGCLHVKNTHRSVSITLPKTQV